MTSGYLRYPHIHGDQVVFVADDDLWLTTVADIWMTGSHVTKDRDKNHKRNV